MYEQLEAFGEHKPDPAKSGHLVSIEIQLYILYFCFLQLFSAVLLFYGIAPSIGLSPVW